MIKKSELIQIRVTKSQKELIEKIAHENLMNMSDYVRYCLLKDRFKNKEDDYFIENNLGAITILNEKINKGKIIFSTPCKEGFKYWDNLKNYFNKNFNPNQKEFKDLYLQILINWEFNRNFELYEEISML